MARRQPRETEPMAVASAPLAVEIVEGFLHSAPVDVRAMASALDLRIVEEDLGEISGKIERDWLDPDDFVITINERHAEVRKRFTIAHEIAHFVLHRDLIGNGIVDDALYRDARIGDQKERQANRYAARLLMPRDLVRSVWNEGYSTKVGLASRFWVSTAVAEIRMEELGCVLWPAPAKTEVDLPF